MAMQRALEWIEAHENGDEVLSGLSPGVYNCLMMYHVLGYRYPEKRHKFRKAADTFLMLKGDEAYSVPSLSPVWDTCLAASALLEAGSPEAMKSVESALDWLVPKQVLDVRGDWAIKRPNLRPGGWAFQYVNPHYPDVDDTAVVALAMDRYDSINGTKQYVKSVSRAVEWISGMQSRDGAWGAFDVDNTSHYLNSIPFADNEGLLDPPTPDITARCLSLLARTGVPASVSSAAVRYLLREQEADGSWWARWGVNYIYGTWSALRALNAAGISHDAPVIQNAVGFLLESQNGDGGWGENCNSYALNIRKFVPAKSTVSQTSWALLGLMAAGQINHPSVARGVKYLLNTQIDDVLWDEKQYTGTGHPNLLYLRYSGYSKYFPLWALARYNNLKRKNDVRGL
jgi:squalene-hopene/tetraprenyl-beta-curcumene cyclase